MANPITVPLPADLPTDWTTNQIVSVDGTSAGYTEQYGYNYLMEQVNNAQIAVSQCGAAIADGIVGTVLQSYNAPQTNAVEIHNSTAYTHTDLNVDGNVDTLSSGDQTLEEHEVNPQAHQNLYVDGNAT